MLLYLPGPPAIRFTLLGPGLSVQTVPEEGPE